MSSSLSKNLSREELVYLAKLYEKAERNKNNYIKLIFFLNRIGQR